MATHAAPRIQATCSTAPPASTRTHTPPCICVPGVLCANTAQEELALTRAHLSRERPPVSPPLSLCEMGNNYTKDVLDTVLPSGTPVGMKRYD